MRSKIHRATVTGSDLNYVGSLTLSPELLKAAGIGVHELVQVVNINNGARFETYTIEGTQGAGDVVVNGAAARLVERGDKIIIITYAQLTEAELADYESCVVHVDDENRIVEVALPLLAVINQDAPPDSSFYQLRGDKPDESGAKVVGSDRKMPEWSRPIRR